MEIVLREARDSDAEPTRRLVIAAFGDGEPPATAGFLDALRMDGCILGEWLAEDAAGVLGHVVFSRVRVEPSSGARLDAALLAPLAVRPDRQRSGIGTALVRAALSALEARGEALFLVLGHPAYYPRFGFAREKARGILGPWSDRPGFMARCEGAPSGRLILPKPIAEAP